MSENDDFRRERADRVAALRRNEALLAAGRDFMTAATAPKYSYNFEWLGRPVIQYPQDLVAMQEIIWKVRPDLIVETGIAHGGSLIFYASMLELIGNGTVLGIDIDIRPHNFAEIVSHPLARRIQMIEGPSTDQRTVQKVHAIARNHQTVMLCLDSNHTHEHVFQELEAYHSLVSVGSYLVVFDTLIEYLPDGLYPDRPWGKGNNPATAVREFLKRAPQFELDAEIDSKLIVTVAPGGYLRRIR